MPLPSRTQRQEVRRAGPLLGRNALWPPKVLQAVRAQMPDKGVRLSYLTVIANRFCKRQRNYSATIGS
eukprot:6187138-Pleurochrysis_carterae.AAC.4